MNIEINFRRKDNEEICWNINNIIAIEYIIICAINIFAASFIFMLFQDIFIDSYILLSLNTNTGEDKKNLFKTIRKNIERIKKEII